MAVPEDLLNVKEFRAYSISSPAFASNTVQFNVRLVPGGIASTYLHAIQEGDEVRFTGPYGEFRLPEDPDTEIICVGGGCGMAPMANIIDTLYHRWPDRSCYLFFGCRTVKDVFYLDRWKALAEKHPNFKFHISLACIFFARRDSFLVTLLSATLYLGLAPLVIGGMVPARSLLIDGPDCSTISGGTARRCASGSATS